MKDVYYEGSEEEWKEVNIHEYGNESLINATIHYNYKYTDSHTHVYKPVVTKKATLTANGKIENKCSCGEVKSTTIIYYPKTIKLSTTSYTYNGSAKKPTITVTDLNNKKIATSNYTVKYKNNISAGTATATVTFKGNYSGTKSLTYKIKPASGSKFNAKLSATSYVYNGKVKAPSVTVKDSTGKTLKKNTDYTVTMSKGRKNVGKYSVTIKFKGNYSGTKTLYFTIKPRAASINKLTAKKKSLTVKLNRSLKQSTGYQIQYATNKTFKSAKSKTVSNYKTTLVNLTKLSAKKTYYVRVRTYKKVGKTTYYSNWSTAKYKKTK